jgi:hypothetical protein
VVGDFGFSILEDAGGGCWDEEHWQDASVTLKQKERRCTHIARSGAWANPRTQKFVRSRPVPWGRGFL